MPRGAAEVADVFRRYGEAYRQQHGASPSTAQRRVMTAIDRRRRSRWRGSRCEGLPMPRQQFGTESRARSVGDAVQSLPPLSLIARIVRAGHVIAAADIIPPGFRHLNRGSAG